MRENPANVINADLGVLILGAPGSRQIVLFDGRALRADLWGPPDGSVLGFIDIQDSRVLREGADFSIYEVNRAVAVSGWGPLLYELAMALAARDGAKGLHADTTEVSPAARAVWLKFAARPDMHVQQAEFNLVGAMVITPKHPRRADLKVLEVRGERWIEKVVKANQNTRADEVRTHLWECGEGLFRQWNWRDKQAQETDVERLLKELERARTAGDEDIEPMENPYRIQRRSSVVDANAIVWGIQRQHPTGVWVDTEEHFRRKSDAEDAVDRLNGVAPAPRPAPRPAPQPARAPRARGFAARAKGASTHASRTAPDDDD